MLIKKVFLVSLLFVVAVLCSSTSYGIDISAASAVVINAQTKEIIFQKNAFEKRSMASTTKIMTSILAIESGRMEESVTVTSSAMAEGTSIGLKSGYVLTLSDLVYGMLLESGNDAANLCALYLGGSFDGFALMMNEKADKIGMTRTNFVTPSGLDDEDHYSTAYDMALLGAYSVENPLFREICSKKRHTVTYISPEISLNFSNHNRLLGSCEGVFGIKTGFTKKSGRCLVTACERDGATLVCVTLNAGDDWNDHRKLYDSAFAELNKSTFSFSELDDVAVYGSDVGRVKVYCDDYIFHFKDIGEVKKEILIPKIIYAPISEDEIIGRINYFSGEKLIHTSYICSSSDVLPSEETYRARFSVIDLIKSLFSKRKER